MMSRPPPRLDTGGSASTGAQSSKVVQHQGRNDVVERAVGKRSGLVRSATLGRRHSDDRDRCREIAARPISADHAANDDAQQARTDGGGDMVIRGVCHATEEAVIAGQ